MKIGTTILVALVSLLLASSPGVASTGGQRASGYLGRGGETAIVPSAGTLLAARMVGARTTVILRRSNGQIERFALPTGSHVLSGDGRAVSTAVMRQGDEVTTTRAGNVVDRSQRRATLLGLVSFSPGPLGHTMVVVIRQLRGVVVDFDAQTRYTDRSRETSSPEQIEEGDLVTVHGLLDAGLGEITATDSMARLAPFLPPRRPHASGRG